jgi:hypothetical protein
MMAISEKNDKRHPTVLRTFRLSAALDDALSKRAAQKGKGKNALIVSILTKYAEWDSLVEDLNYLIVPSEILNGLLAGADKELISSVAKLAAKNVASSLPLWYGSSNLQSLLKYFETSIKYSGAGLQQRIERQDNVVRIIVYQPFNENGTAFARTFNTALVQEVLGYPPEIIVHSDSIETIIETQ